MADVLLSIKPKYVEKILEGTKEVEFRKQIFKDPSVNLAYIYASYPVKKIVGYFSPLQIIEGHPNTLWERFCEQSGISKQDYFEYFAGKETGYAIKIDNLAKFETPLDPYEIFENFIAPQSFCYLEGCPQLP